MSNTSISRPTPLNSTINSRSNVRMYITPERAESNSNISGFINESPYTGPGTRLQSQREGNETNSERILSTYHRLQTNINDWEASIKTSAYFSSVEINRRFNLITKDVENLSRQALMAAVSTAILRDISDLRDQFTQTKLLGLRNASSQIELSSLRPEIRVELLSPPITNLSVTPTSVDRMQYDIEVQN